MICLLKSPTGDLINGDCWSCVHATNLFCKLPYLVWIKNWCPHYWFALSGICLVSPLVLTYLCPSLPVEHRPSTTPRQHTLFWAALAIPDQLVPCCFCFSVSPPTVTRPASLPLPLRVPGQGLACGAGCWLPEGVSHPAPLPPQYLLGHWFLSRSPGR